MTIGIQSTVYSLVIGSQITVHGVNPIGVKLKAVLSLCDSTALIFYVFFDG
jgi:hypothetical protein